MTTADQRTYARKIECEEDGLYFGRFFFQTTHGRQDDRGPAPQGDPANAQSRGGW